MEEQGKTWDDVPEYIKKTFDRLGIPEAEQKFLGGVSAQYESEVVYHSIREDLTKQGVIFLDLDSALREHPEIVRKYFGTVIPPTDNKFAALNTAVWSGGSFIYVPARREGRDPAPGLLPDQRREHGAVRADARSSPTRVRACTTSRGARPRSTRTQLAALGGGRADRDGRRLHPLHDDPELVEQHLQPRHQAGRRPQERDRRVGRREHRHRS